MTDKTPILELLEKFQELDGPTRFILLVLIHSQVEHDYDKPLLLKHKDLQKITGVSRGKIIKIMVSLLNEGYLFKLQGKLFLNGFKLQSVKQGHYLPKRVPYRKQAA